MFDPNLKLTDRLVAKLDKRLATQLRKTIKQAWTQPGSTTKVTLKTGTVVYMAMAETDYSTRFSGFTNQAEYKTFAAANIKSFEIVPYDKIRTRQWVRFNNGNSFETGQVEHAVTLTNKTRRQFGFWSASLRMGEQVFIIRQKDGRRFYGVPRWDVYGVIDQPVSTKRNHYVSSQPQPAA